MPAVQRFPSFHGVARAEVNDIIGGEKKIRKL